MNINEIKFKKTYVGKSKITSGDEYIITLTYNGNQCRFKYHDNYLNNSDIKDCLYSLILDSDTVDWCCDVDEFMREYGYEYYEAKRIINECKKNRIRYHRLFNEIERKEIEKLLEEY